MKIIIIGDGKIGSVLAEQLSKEDHEVTLIDQVGERLEQSNKDLDVMVVEGDGSSHEIQKEAGVEEADLVIACTGADELNLLCCLIAKKLGAKHTIARVRNPMYVEELSLIKDDLGLSMSINPERECALEMARVLRLPSAIKIDTFAKGQVEILKLNVTAESPLDGIALMEMGKFKSKVLVCAVERGEREVHIPSGERSPAILPPDRRCQDQSPPGHAYWRRSYDLLSGQAAAGKRHGCEDHRVQSQGV